jgi:PAS domain S-box-containing protein
MKNKLEELEQTVSLNRSGQTEEARALVLTNDGKKTMDQIRAVTDELWDTETVLERSRSAEYQRRVRSTVASVYGATLVAVIALVLVAYFLLRNLRDREIHSALLREREQWFRVTLNSIGDGVMATDAHGKVVFLNDVAATLTGILSSEAVNRPIQEVFPIFNENTMQSVVNPVGKVLEQGRTIGLANHTVLKHKDGRLIPIEDSAAPIRNDQNKIIGVVLVFRDATFERHSQDMMRRAEKLATAGRLAATMAHEINNPLEAVGNLIFIVKSSSELHPETRAYLDHAEQQLERVSHITRQTLGFYRESAEPAEVSMSALIDSVLRLYDNKLRTKGITVERKFEQCPPVHGLAGELRQMMANLIANAADALPENGKLVLAVLPFSNNGTSGVEVRVSDNGVGIPPENMERIFEPFFTTKADVGTGLGLWVTKQIAERHGGTVRVTSKQDGPVRGSEFSIVLPHAVQDEAASAAG